MRVAACWCRVMHVSHLEFFVFLRDVETLPLGGWAWQGVTTRATWLRVATAGSTLSGRLPIKKLPGRNRRTPRPPGPRKPTRTAPRPHQHTTQSNEMPGTNVGCLRTRAKVAPSSLTPLKPSRGTCNGRQRDTRRLATTDRELHKAGGAAGGQASDAYFLMRLRLTSACC